MKTDARLFNCALCYRQTIICGCCDRGNIYCSSICSAIARKASRLAASHRYQKSYQGRFKHAARQRQYRARLRKKVTHQGSPASSTNDSLSSELRTDPALPIKPEKMGQHQCHFCLKKCTDFIRMGFMARKGRVQTQRTIAWPLGP